MQKKIWIDLDNSPHVPFFKPIIDELDRRGFTIILTARDCFQVCGLANYYKLRYKRIGRHYGKNKFLKVFGLLLRTVQLTPAVWSEKPDLAVSHGSRAQLTLAKLLKIPSIVITDYEHAKALIKFISPSWVIMPEVIRDDEFNLDKARVLKYPGIKEDVYVPGFRPSYNILDELGIKESDIVVTIRPPAAEAHYRSPQSEELFRAVMEFLCEKECVRLVILPRNEKQAARLKKIWPSLFAERKIIIPNHVVDGLNLIWHSDLVISGGGTMNREAAALGVPVYSIFRGKIGAVDRHLADIGRLTLLENVEDVRAQIKLLKHHRPNKLNVCGVTLKSIVDSIDEVMAFRS